MMELKERLYNYCRDYINSGIAAAQQSIDDARAAAQNETKSSAGDKYETAREMMQQEIDIASQRINELHKLKAMLDQINPSLAFKTVQPGSLVLTSHGNYYIAISVGKAMIGGDAYYILSPVSPLGGRLIGMQANDILSFNGKAYSITQVL